MSLPSATRDVTNTNLPGASDTRLRGRWLIVARSVWLVLAAGLLANWIASLFAYHAILRRVCTTNPAQCPFWQPTPGNVRALQSLGLTVDAYANYFISVEIVFSLACTVVGVLIFWRKSHEWLGLFVSFVLLLFGSFGISETLNGTFANGQTPLIIDVLGGILGLIQWPCLAVLLLTFPTGRFAPRWTWTLALLWVAQLVYFLLPAPYNISYWPGWLVALELLMTWGGTASVQVYRYLRVYTPAQRQQTKWVVFGELTGVLFNVITGIIQAVVPGFNAPDAPYQLLGGLFTAFLFLPFPITVGIAILRYRLWDIDAIINKALVYGSLTALLVAAYVGLVIGLSALLRSLFGHTADSAVTIVASTLVVAALFQPVRKRIQAVIDRRFYRKKYDAARTLAVFSATLRNEVDLEQLREQLLAVVEETMQPAHVSLWLRPPEREKKPPS